MDWIKTLLSSSEDASSLRIVLLLSFTSVIGVWTHLSIEKQALLPIPESVISLLGLLLATKWAQKIEEKEK